MRNIIGFVLLLLLLAGCNQSANNKSYDFSRADLFEVLPPDNKRFDLSGLVLFDSVIVGVADKPWNNFLYSFYPNDSESKLVSNVFISLDYSLESDFEAIDYSDSIFYIADERHSVICTYDLQGQEMQKLSLTWPHNVDAESWGNAGIEAIAIDQANEKIYIGKERDKPALFVASLEGGDVKQLDFNNLPEDFDVSDMKFQNHHLYLLIRSNYQVIKWDINKEEIIDTFDYSFVMNANGEKAYSGSRYPMAEGLILTSEYIWVALDNNGDSFNSKNPWIEMSKFAGDNPLLVRFKRPEDF